jgi:hypothetical protein
MEELSYHALTWKGRTQALVDCLGPDRATALPAICSIGWFEEDVVFAESLLLGILLVGDDAQRDCAMIGLTHLAQRTRGELTRDTQLVLKRLIRVPASSERAADTLADVRAFRRASKRRPRRQREEGSR